MAVRRDTHPGVPTGLLTPWLQRRSAPWWPWIVLGASVGAWIAVSVLMLHQPFYVGLRRLRFFDLDVYRATTHDMLAGLPIYDMPVYRGMQFTYPPFAALALLPTSLVSSSLAAGVSVVVNLGCLLGILKLTPSLQPRATTGTADGETTDGETADGETAVDEAVPGSGWGTVALVAAALLWSEPVSTTIGYGQIDLVITLLVVWDLSRRPRSSLGGIGIGLASGLKLTPLIFIPYLLLVRERRSAITATTTFLLTLAVGFIFAPADSLRYWNGLFLSSSRTGTVADAANQSLTGLITRLTGTQHLAPAWLAVDGLVAIVGLGLAARAGRRGERGVGFAICALTSLLVSPVSWTHHWVLMIPAVFALWRWAQRRRARWLQAILAVLVVVSFLYLPELLGEGARVGLGALGQLAGMPYVLVGCAVLVSVVAVSSRSAASRTAT